MVNKGLLFVVSGPSGAGKGTLCQQLLDGDLGLKYSVSATTRPPRPMEVDGEDYFFFTREEFLRTISEDGFLEWAEIYGNLYGTPRKFVEESLARGEDLVLEIDAQGAMQVREKFPEGIFIFILPPSMEELHNRLVKRGSETEEIMKERLACAAEELSYANQYDYLVVNDYVKEAAFKIKSIVVAERCRVRTPLR